MEIQQNNNIKIVKDRIKELNKYQIAQEEFKISPSSRPRYDRKKNNKLSSNSPSYKNRKFENHYYLFKEGSKCFAGIFIFSCSKIHKYSATKGKSKDCETKCKRFFKQEQKVRF